ncbi:MAG: hypothetical protein KF691_14630 [Phycisphaeraceae bacterium]|nr:hypothetical protein [Phycisphaeraceae bacterium]
MKVLFDQGTPAPLRRALSAFDVKIAREMNWDRLENGELLRAAEEAFDAFITTDQGLKYQQNNVKRKLAILVLPTTSWPRIQSNVEIVVQAVERLSPGDFVELAFPAE